MSYAHKKMVKYLSR